MGNEILFRAVIEVVGKPKEHVEESMKRYLAHLRKDKNYQIVNEDLAEIKKQEKEELWAIFAELEIKTNHLPHLVSFGFNYMPAVIDILEPIKITLNNGELANLVNDFQARLHQVDLVAKQLKAENEFMRKNLGGLLKNYVTVLLSKGALTAKQLSGLTGMDPDKLGDFLDQMIDKSEINLKEGKYSLAKK